MGRVVSPAPNPLSSKRVVPALVASYDMHGRAVGLFYTQPTGQKKVYHINRYIALFALVRAWTFGKTARYLMTCNVGRSTGFNPPPPPPTKVTLSYQTSLERGKSGRRRERERGGGGRASVNTLVCPSHRPFSIASVLCDVGICESFSLPSPDTRPAVMVIGHQGEMRPLYGQDVGPWPDRPRHTWSVPLPCGHSCRLRSGDLNSRTSRHQTYRVKAVWNCVIADVDDISFSLSADAEREFTQSLHHDKSAPSWLLLVHEWEVLPWLLSVHEWEVFPWLLLVREWEVLPWLLLVREWEVLPWLLLVHEWEVLPWLLLVHEWRGPSVVAFGPRMRGPSVVAFGPRMRGPSRGCFWSTNNRSFRLMHSCPDTVLTAVDHIEIHPHSSCGDLSITLP